MKTVHWFFDCWILNLFYGPRKEEAYHFHMFERWGERYNVVYIKSIQPAVCVNSDAEKWENNPFIKKGFRFLIRLLIVIGGIEVVYQLLKITQ